MIGLKCRHKLSGQIMVIVTISETIATCELIEEPKEYKVGSDSFDYKRAVCQMANLEPVNNQLKLI